jgi:DNA repair protein RecO (recombination protein O)
MPGLYKDEGIVLKTIKLGEADRIVTIFTRGNGKVRAVAKGVRKTKSRFGARLEPFTHVELLIYKGRNLDTVTGADIVSSFDSIRTDYHRLTAAAVLVEMVDKITPDTERAASTYNLLLDGLRAIALIESESIVPAFLVKLLSISGYHPQLTTCAGCGSTGPLSGFSAGLGGAVCESCLRDDRDSMPLAPDRIALISWLLASDLDVESGADAAATTEITLVLRRYAEYHLERPLKSLQLHATA